MDPTLHFPGPHFKRDSWVSVVYAKGLHSTTSAVTLQRTARHGRSTTSPRTVAS
jgi:hypothetical protein